MEQSGTTNGCAHAGRETSRKKHSAESVENKQPTKTQKQHGAGGNGKDGGASPRQAPPKSPTPCASGETTKTTNNDTRRKITRLEEATKTARELGDEDMLQAIEKKLQVKAAKKNAELEKQREQVERAQEKLNRLQAEAMEADKKVTTLRAEALTSARTQEGQKLSPRDYFEKIAKGLAVVKESLKEGEKKSSRQSN